MRRVGKGLVLTLALLLLLFGCQNLRLSGRTDPGTPPDDALRVASFNVHYILMRRQTGAWSRGDWDRRKAAVDAAFKALDADLVAFQEMESFAGGDNDDVNLARSYLLGLNPAYAAAAIGNWREFPSTQPVFYRTDRLRVVDQGWFFFSETPEVIYSRTFDGSYPAFASWVIFEERGTGARFRVINLHLDYSSRENRRRSTALVAGHVARWHADAERVVLLGDLNALHGSALHDELEAAGLTFLRVPGATYHMARGLHLFGAIDHVALGGAVSPVGEAKVLRLKPDGIWPSDHHPILADIKLDKAD